MKNLVLSLTFLSSLLHAQEYVLSGGKDIAIHYIASNVLQKAYSRAGLKMKPIYIAPEESLIKANKGETDGDLARINTIRNLYPNLRQVPVSIVSIGATAFSKDLSLKINNWEDLRGHKFAIVKGVKFVEAATQTMQRDILHNYQEAFEHLQNDKTDILVLSTIAGLNFIFNHHYDTIKPISPTLQSLKLYHYVHKKNAHLIPVLTPVLQAMEKSGELQYLNNSYLRSITN